MRLRRSSLIVFVLVGLMSVPTAGAVAPPRRRMAQPSSKTFAPNNAKGVVADNFELVGHTDLGATDINAEVWVHENFAYVGTWLDPCERDDDGRGIKVIDVSDPANPTMTGRLAAIPGTFAQDVVVRAVSTPSFTGDLLATGFQDCADRRPQDEAKYGVDLWNVTDPATPVHLAHLPISAGGDVDGVHELDMVQRGQNVYVLATTPFQEFEDAVDPNGDFWIVDVTNPRQPAIAGEWGAGQEGLSPGDSYGQGSFGSMFGHSARASADGKTAYVSYWDLGVVTLDISDPT